MKLILASTFLLLSHSSALAQCATWSSSFAIAPDPSEIRAITVFDDGGGPDLYIAMKSLAVPPPIGEIGRVLRWNGATFEVVFESATVGTSIESITAGDDGGGAALFITERRSVSLWFAWRGDGVNWTQIGAFNGVVRVQVLDDGSGPAPIATGGFSLTSSGLMNNAARFDGSAWVQYGGGPTGFVAAAASYDDGSGPRLYTCATGVSPVQVWTGTNWQPAGTGLNGAVNALAVFDDGTGAKLCAGGFLTAAVGPGANLAFWNGGAWVCPVPLNSTVKALASCNFGAGPRLLVSGNYSLSTPPPVYQCAIFDGSTLTAFDGSNGLIHSFAVQGSGIGARLFAASQSHAALWISSGTRWNALGEGVNDVVHTFAVHDGGTGPELIVGGAFNSGGSFEGLGKIARWDGHELSPVGTGVAERVRALSSATLAGSTSLYAGGDFTFSYGQFLRGVARWTGANWAPLASGVFGHVYALTEFDAGSGARLIAGGNFAQAGGGPGNFIAAWDGTSWSALGSGMNGVVAALARYDAGAGEQLYAGGTFTTAGGNSANRVARWDGANWSALTSGVDAGVNALCAFDDGQSTQLYAGGAFTSAGGVPVSFLARWDGSAWSDVPGGGPNGGVLALGVHDDGRGPALYVGGGFDSIGGITAYNLARFDGVSWEAVDGGLDGYVDALVSFDDDGDGDNELFAGGAFTNGAHVSSGRIARLEGCPHYTSFCAGDGQYLDHTTPCPCGNDGAAGRGCASSFVADGALLEASGSTANDTLVLHVIDTPQSSLGIYLQHDAQDDRVFHDGVLCANGNLIRLRRHFSVGGESMFPDSTDTTTIAQRGSVTPGSGSTRFYSCFYRNASTTFCPPATANVSNGIRVIW